MLKPSQMLLDLSTLSLEGVDDLLNTRQCRLLIERGLMVRALRSTMPRCRASVIASLGRCSARNAQRTVDWIRVRRMLAPGRLFIGRREQHLDVRPGGPTRKPAVARGRSTMSVICPTRISSQIRE
jgi:hypothetical protein